jgi:hypothetical protein
MKFVLFVKIICLRRLLFGLFVPFGLFGLLWRAACLPNLLLFGVLKVQALNFL